MVKTKEEIEIMREGGKRLAFVLDEVVKLVKPGVDAKELNDLAEKLIKKGGDIPAFLNYKPQGSIRPYSKDDSYPATLCVSVNNEVVHGIPNWDKKILKEGDIVGLDCGLKHKGLIVDAGLTVGVGKISKEDQKLIDVTEGALKAGIKVARAGNTVGDIGHAIEQFVKPHGYGIVYELVGHGVGCELSEPPEVPNFGEKGEGPELKAGMTLAIEPIINKGSGKVFLDEDGHTYKTADGQRGAYSENTILITEGDAEVLTKGE
ncbi:MAG: type I methionyl aminopeptidase [Candidatus Pacebacteria bacterium]|jgi:methionyl aminopeptidase|nr:type I methionyl aminopeptidase [Parcubacteria group bacterium]MDP6249420.1 type I methionyl aminopeptidase [Candidatus Paceibacterota bacterium]MDP7159598.1 type I methionyl aminopeptidase [Candidatus Paceibacterota bacterium]MDP7366317.1 type I methionyl aminopeptidase [Candidatus Paceibacterota bacterium]MDP7466206.1 type I methionyl aminopeptidase [Candidatus Paceibacterota bacterium]|tara:strand:- start:17 stop:802 length:786 start_codon:yes stop_codon:yes gene_type:complete